MKSILLAVFGLVFLLLGCETQDKKAQKAAETPAHTGVQPAPEDQAPDQE